MLDTLRVLPCPSTSILLFKISPFPAAGCCQENAPRRSDGALGWLCPPPGRPLTMSGTWPLIYILLCCMLAAPKILIGSWYLSFLISESNKDMLSHRADGFVEYVHSSSHYSAKLLYFSGAFSPLIIFDISQFVTCNSAHLLLRCLLIMYFTMSLSQLFK